jgi:hypothetical protein
MCDAELRRRAADLGELTLVDLALTLAGDEVMPTPIGVQRPEQAMPPDNRTPQRSES